MKKSNSESRCSFFKKSTTPGPGSYDPPSKICEGPYYLIRGRGKAKASSGKQPGPGQYDLPAEKIVGGFVMGVSQRTFPKPDTIKSNLPGPGTYEIRSKTLGIPWQFHPDSKKAPRPSTTLGPGTYDLPNTLFNRTFTLAGKIKQLPNKTKSLVPGPGTYEPSMVKSQSSTYIGISKRPEIRDNKMPGPGSYTVQLRPSTSSSSFGIGNRTELKNTLECNTSYELPTSIGEGPKISLHPRLKERKSYSGPGPGAYNPELPGKIPSFVFGSSKGQLFDTKVRSPGPIYNIEKKLEVPTHSFTWSRRDGTVDKEKTPGPGTYETKSSLNESLITLKSKLKDYSLKNSFEMPGPGTYDQSGENGEKGWSFAKDSRKLEWTKEQKEQIKKKIDNNNNCKCMNPNLKHRK
jgi:hypothetical protein